jgi:radical SAM protein with 4Fe4S-binding SPASM domain
MPMDRVKRVAEFLADASRKWREEKIYLIWHGGEPLVLPPDYFYEAGAIFDEFLPGHEEGIQTSLMPYSNKYKGVIRDRFRGGIGTSVDFDARQIKGSSQAYQEKWMEKVSLARSHHHVLGLLVTPAKGDLGRAKERIDWLVNREFDYFNFERYNSFGQTLTAKPSNREHAQFLIDVMDAIVERIEQTGFAPMIPVLAAVIGGIENGMPGDRWGGSCQHDFIVVEPDGSLNNCPDKASFEPAYANISDGVAGFQNSPMRKKWIRIQQTGHRIHECETCENNTWCKSGCPITPNADPHGDETECSGYKTFINYTRVLLGQPKTREMLLGYRSGKYTPTWSADGMKPMVLPT